ncbi:MAG: hypothetical protein U5J98_10690 [Halobacteriales archaeon]|nr:hypothetical protein [Halobacteriales archaeon]
MEQADYRAVMDLRERLEGGELTPETAAAHAGDALGLDDPDPDQVHEWLGEAEIGLELDGRNAPAVDEALQRVAEGDHEGAIETLRDRFASVCERQRPGLGENAHPAACHLHDDATSRLDERLAADDSRSDEPAAESAADD